MIRHSRAGGNSEWQLDSRLRGNDEKVQHSLKIRSQMLVELPLQQSCGIAIGCRLSVTVMPSAVIVQSLVETGFDAQLLPTD